MLGGVFVMEIVDYYGEYMILVLFVAWFSWFCIPVDSSGVANFQRIAVSL
jgi:hypothetical protein